MASIATASARRVIRTLYRGSGTGSRGPQSEKSRRIRCDLLHELPRVTAHMISRIILGVVAAAAACASWNGRPQAAAEPTFEVTARAPRASIYGVPALDSAYRELETEMRAHGCMACHTPSALQLLDSRRSIEAMLEANLMPPATDDHAAGIPDADARAGLLRRAKVFRSVGDATVANW